jgi:hypothetical protein
MADIGAQWIAAVITGPISIASILVLSHAAKKPDQFVRLPMYMFFSLTVFVVCLIVAVSFFPEQSADENFPISMMKNYNGTQWVLNIGGVRDANSLGIQIPVYIIVLGILGAYVRYLYTGIKEFKLEFRDDLRRYGRNFNRISIRINEIERTIAQNEASIPDLPPAIQRQVKTQRDSYVVLKETSENELRRNNYNLSIDITNHILNTVGFFLLGPLLAVMAWLILLVSNATNQWIFALVALTVGFTANSIISRATNMAGNRISGEKTNIEVKTDEGKTSVLLSASKEKAGVVITLTGEGFSPRSGISMQFDEDDLATDPVEVRADALGRFSAKFTVPQSNPGEYEITIEDDEGKTAAVTFTVMS